MILEVGDVGGKVEDTDHKSYDYKFKSRVILANQMGQRKDKGQKHNQNTKVKAATLHLWAL
jgi:hypothetical protein